MQPSSPSPAYYSIWFIRARALLELPKWNVIILLLKTPISFKSLNVVCKQNTFWNVKRDIRCRENTAFVALFSNLAPNMFILVQATIKHNWEKGK